MSKRGFFTDILSVASTNTFSTFVKFCIGVILARVLGAEGKGIYAAILVIPNMVISLTELGVRRATIIHIGKKIYSTEKIISVLLFFLLATSIAGILITLGVFRFENHEAFTIPLIILAVLSIPIRLTNRYVRGVIIGEQKYRMSNIIKWLPLLFNLISLIVFIVLLPWNLFGALLSLLLSNFFVSVLALRQLMKEHKIGVKYDFKVIKSLLQMGIVYAIAVFLVRLNFRIDIILLANLSDYIQVGYYNLGASVAESWQAPFAVGAVILSTSANTKKQSVVNMQINNLLRVSFLISILAAVIVYFAVPFFLPIIYSKEFIPSIPIVQQILPAVIIVILGKIIASRLAGLEKTYLVIFIYIPALVLNILLNLYFIPKYQAIGAVYSTNISYAFSLVFMLIVYSRVTKQSLFNVLIFQKSDFGFLKNLKKSMKAILRVKPKSDL